MWLHWTLPENRVLLLRNSLSPVGSIVLVYGYRANNPSVPPERHSVSRQVLHIKRNASIKKHHMLQPALREDAMGGIQISGDDIHAVHPHGGPIHPSIHPSVHQSINPSTMDAASQRPRKPMTSTESR